MKKLFYLILFMSLCLLGSGPLSSGPITGTVGTRIALVPNGTYYYTYNQSPSIRSLALYNNNTNVNGSFAVSLKPVTAPSSSGATIVSAKAGETYNFNHKNASFTYNAASYYVIIRAIR